MGTALAPSDTRTQKTTTLVFRVVLSLLVSGLFVWLSLRRTDLRAVMHTMASAKPLPLILYFVILLLVHLVRTVRWGLLLEPVGQVGFKRLNSASAIGFMLLMLLPLRLGELARPILVTGRDRRDPSRPSLSGALASCVVERLVDGVALGVLGIIALHVLRATGGMADFARRASWIVTAAFLALCLALATALLMRDLATRFVRGMLERFAPSFAGRAVSMMEEFLAALDLGSPWRVSAVIVLTVAHWGLHIVGFTLLAPAFSMQLTLLMACAVLAAQAVGVMVPAGPGMVGTSQFFTQAGLSIFVPGALTIPAVAAQAAGFANSVWMLQFGQQVALGLVFWFSDRVSLAGVIGKGAQQLAASGELRAESSVTA
jgi:glycosyltransferase 2 family protein